MRSDAGQFFKAVRPPNPEARWRRSGCACDTSERFFDRCRRTKQPSGCGEPRDQQRRYPARRHARERSASTGRRSADHDAERRRARGAALRPEVDPNLRTMEAGSEDGARVHFCVSYNQITLAVASLSPHRAVVDRENDVEASHKGEREGETRKLGTELWTASRDITLRPSRGHGRTPTVW